MPNVRRLLPFAVLLATISAAPVFADDWETCAKGKGDDAIAACSRAIKSGTYTGRVLALAYSNRGVELKAKGDLAKAIADYDEAIKADPQQSAAYNNRGIAYAAMASYDKAIADYDAAIRLDPKYASALNKIQKLIADGKLGDVPENTSVTKIDEVKASHPMTLKVHW